MSRTKKKDSEGRESSVPPVKGAAIPDGEFDQFGVADFLWAGAPSVLEHVREYLGMDQRDFGQMMGGFSRSQIARFETGDSDPSISFWVRFTKVTAMSLTWVFTGLGNPYEVAMRELPDWQAIRRWVDLAEEREEAYRRARNPYSEYDFSAIKSAASGEIRSAAEQLPKTRRRQPESAGGKSKGRKKTGADD